MPKFFIKDNQIIDNKIVIKDEDVNHITNVLRKQIKDTLEICNIDDSTNYIAEITNVTKTMVELQILKKHKPIAESEIYIHIFQGLPKSDKMELIIQKSTELGVKEITPIQMERCIVKLEGKDKDKKIERWQKIAEVAAKQSGRDVIPKINTIEKIKNIYETFKNYDIVIVAYENEENTTLKQVLTNAKLINKYKKIAVIIGPEGGIDFSEIEKMEKNGAHIITLGKRILRTETVALSMISMIMYEFEGDA